MTREEAIQIFLDRGWIKLENGTYFDGSKWREAIMVISDYFRNEYKALEHEPRKEHWEHGKELCKEYQGKLLVDVIYADWHCSNCGYVIKGTVKPKWNYCPNCGTKMEGDKE